MITQKNNLVSKAYFECGYRCRTCEKDNINLCLSCNEEYPLYYNDAKDCHKSCPNESYIIIKDDNGNLGCELCEQKCRTCEGINNHCTSCREPYFMENNKCALNCSEGYSPDYIIRNCYEIININRTTIEEKIVYNNVSIQEPNYIYIENNICQKNETEN